MNPGRVRTPTCPPTASSRPSDCPTRWPGFPITRLVSSPQRRAIQTAQPVADALGLTIDVDDRLAEYDHDLAHYTPIEEASQEDLQRLIDGHLPGGVDEDAFIARVKAGVDDIVAAAAHEDTVALFSHGGVINALVHDIMKTKRLLCVQVDYAGITRLLSSRTGKLGVAASTRSEHVWDLLPRNQQW